MSTLDRSLLWLRQHLSYWLPGVIGIAYLAAWLTWDAGRYPFMDKAFVFLLLAAAIGVSAWRPWISLGIIVGVPLLQLVGVLYPPTSNTWAAYFGLGIVAIIVGIVGRGLLARLALPIGAVASALVALRMVAPSVEGRWSDWTGSWLLYREHPIVEDFFVIMLVSFGLFAGFWAVGVAIGGIFRTRSIRGVLREAETRLEETDFELRLSQDRARISRDVHDALAHSLAVIVAQAEGALALQSAKPKVATEALGNIAAVGRTALVDVRSLVERIHDSDVTNAKPTIGELDELVAHLREIGMDVTLRVLGDPRELPATHELAVFRIVQESLTNALKHSAPPAVAAATLDWKGEGLAILVSSHGGDGVVERGERGVGIAGMKERARLAGGWLTAEDAEDGSFVVTAFIPVAATARQVVDA